MLNSLLTHLSQVAPETADIPILQPADPFLDTAGEDLRRRIFITEAADGSLNCLRPDFTIPICQQHIEGDAKQARYAYGGTVFRQGREGAVEFQQAGLEDLGMADSIAADVACLADMIDGLERCGVSDFRITLGDQQLFAAVVKALELPVAQAERLERNFGAPDVLSDLIASYENGTTRKNGDDQMGALASAGDEAGLIAMIEAKMQQAGLSPKAGRSPQDIAHRMIAKAAESHFQLSADRAAILRTYLALETPLLQAEEALIEFAGETGIDFGDALTAFAARNEGVGGRGVALENFTFRASFGRKLDYYTGVLFEAYGGSGDVLAGGGRYDRLCTILGADQPVPAVGFSIMIDRVEEALK